MLASENAILFYSHLLHRLHHSGILSLFDLIYCWNLGAPIWKSTKMLGLQGSEAHSWECHKALLQAMGLYFRGEGDIMLWNGKFKGARLLVKDEYENQIAKMTPDPTLSPFYIAWNLKIPTKIILFAWLLWKNRVLTWEVL